MDAVRKSGASRPDPLVRHGNDESAWSASWMPTAGTSTGDRHAGGVPIPKAFLQAVVGYYTTTPEMPTGFNLDSAFTLPQRIRQVDLQRGVAVIVQ
jgi:hypothetical protein